MVVRIMIWDSQCLSSLIPISRKISIDSTFFNDNLYIGFNIHHLSTLDVAISLNMTAYISWLQKKTLCKVSFISLSFDNACELHEADIHRGLLTIHVQAGTSCRYEQPSAGLPYQSHIPRSDTSGRHRKAKAGTGRQKMVQLCHKPYQTKPN